MRRSLARWWACYGYCSHTSNYLDQNVAYELIPHEPAMTIKLRPAWVLAYRSRGLAYDAMGEYDQAVADFNRAKELEAK
jgi:hypothetical protein